MPRTKISEFSATPANNTDIDSINISEGCAPSGINDAIRELMAQLKDFQTGAVGDSFNGPVGTSTAAAGAFTTLAASGNVTLSGGTANGVAYLNGSKVVTSGSSFSYDGAGVLTLGNDSVATVFNAVGDVAQYVVDSNGTGSSASHQWRYGSTEAMRLNSTGLGIGTSSPSALAANYTTVDIRGATGGALRFGNATDSAYIYSDSNETNIATATNKRMIFSINTSEKMRLDTSGNLGLGVTPSAGLATANYRLFEIGLDGGGSIYSGTNQTLIGTNIAWSGGTANYKRTGSAPTLYNQQNGAHSWSTAASGTAGNAITFTQAMTLDASGNLGIGRTSPSAKLDVGGTSVKLTNNDSADVTVQIGPDTPSAARSGRIGLITSSTQKNWYVANSWNVSGALEFTQTTAAGGSTMSGTPSMVLDSSGNLLVGTTSGSERLRVSATNNAAGFLNTTAASATAFSWNQATSGNNIFYDFGTEASFTSRGSITYNRGAGLVAYNVTSDYRAKDINGPVVNSGALIDSVPVYMGKMKGATQERPMFIAHETPSYAHTGEKDAVDEDGNPVYQQMDASALIPVMWAEIQSLRKRLADAGI